MSAFDGSTLDQIGMTPFDPSLGTLDSVNIGILGTLTVSGITLPYGTSAPFPYEVVVNQSFDGLIGYFDFESDAIFRFSGIYPGGAEPFFQATLFSYGFTLNSTTDLVGFTFPSFSSTVGTLQPPVSVSGQLAGFYPNLPQINEVDLRQSWSGTNVVTISNVQAAGSITIQYNYTPGPTEPPMTPVPEPGTSVLLGSALACLMLRRCRRTSDQPGHQSHC